MTAIAFSLTVTCEWCGAELHHVVQLGQVVPQLPNRCTSPVPRSDGKEPQHTYTTVIDAIMVGKPS